MWVKRKSQAQYTELHYLSWKVQHCYNFKIILADTWDEVKRNLRRNFAISIKLEELFNKNRHPWVCFRGIKNRVLQLKRNDPTFELHALGNSILHLLAGLTKIILKIFTKTKKNEEFSVTFNTISVADKFELMNQQLKKMSLRLALAPSND